MNRRLVAVALAVGALVLLTVVFALRSSDEGSDDGQARDTTTTVTTPAREAPEDPPTTDGGTTSDGADPPATPEPEAPSNGGDGTGSIHEEAEVIPGEMADPAPLGTPAEAAPGVLVELRMAPVEVEGRRPGERSGPGVAVTAEIANGSDRDVAVDGVTVDLVTVAGTSAVLVADPTTEAPPGVLPPGQRRAGTYVFVLPVEDRAGVTVHVKYAADVPTVVFVGDAPVG